MLVRLEYRFHSKDNMYCRSLRRLSESNTVNLQDPQYILREKPKSASCLGNNNRPPFFFPKRQTSLPKVLANCGKMDMFVPSPGMTNAHFVSSPSCSSMYDQDKVDLTAMCGGNTFSNSNMESVNLEDMSYLDDLENGSLKNFLTTDVINSLQNSAGNTQTDLSWASKDVKTSSMAARSNADSFGHNPTLTQINMGPDMAFVDEILNSDGDITKLSTSSFDFLSEINNSPASYDNVSSPSTPKTNVSVLSTSNATLTPDSSENPDSRLTAIGSTYTSNTIPVKNNFPPRTFNPPVVGIVAPVKQTTTEKLDVQNQSSDLVKSTDVKPCGNLLQELLRKDLDRPDIVSGLPIFKNHSKTKDLASPSSETPAQIVPTSSPVKTEPSSPKPALKRHAAKEESIEEKWMDVQNFLNASQSVIKEEPPLKKRKRCDSGSSGHVSDDDDEYDDDDDFNSMYGSKDDGDDSDDDMSDIDADLAHLRPSDNFESLIDTGKKQKQFFWQYNVQSKGPKGTRLKLAVESPADPHVLNDFEDPVFDECNTSIAGIRHGGKARKGDGNEITPNPRKLYLIGHQLMRLNQQINACQLGPDVPLDKRNASKREKNKLASRACRLKKKAQHEANKIKLYGLEQEHSQLNSVFSCIWPDLRNRAKALLAQQVQASPSITLKEKLQALVASTIHERVAGRTTDYINSVIIKFEGGDKNGGMNIKKKQKS